MIIALLPGPGKPSNPSTQELKTNEKSDDLFKVNYFDSSTRTQISSTPTRKETNSAPLSTPPNVDAYSTFNLGQSPPTLGQVTSPKSTKVNEEDDTPVKSMKLLDSPRKEVSETVNVGAADPFDGDDSPPEKGGEVEVEREENTAEIKDTASDDEDDAIPQP